MEIVNFVDSIRGEVVSPELFRKYALRAYRHQNQRLHQAGRFTTAYWDGAVKPLLRFANSCGLDGIEAVTPLPQGDVTLGEVREAFGDRLFLMDRLAALLFDATLHPLETLIAQARERIELFAGRLILGISDEVPSRGDMERIEAVTRIVDDYNASVRQTRCGISRVFRRTILRWKPCHDHMVVFARTLSANTDCPGNCPCCPGSRRRPCLRRDWG